MSAAGGALTEPLRRYLRTEAGGAALLLLATVAALGWANSPFADSYDTFWHTELALRLGDAELELSLQHWVNDGLMVFFFFVIGLEVKREFVMGELVDRRRAAVPLVAAATGLVVPALVYLALNPSGPAAGAWGVVISTDTAFMLGVLALVGPACPTQLRLFLLTLAVADDVGALAVIAVFYTEDLALGPLALSVAGLGLMLALRWLRVWRGPAYLVVGVGVWLAMYLSGVHPTIAGVVIALMSPTYPARRTEVEDAERLTRAYRQSPNASYARAARLSIDRSVSPNERLSQLYLPWTSYVIVPIFALANAGVTLDAEVLRTAATSPVTLGVVAGLVLGKLAGILLGVLVAVRARLGMLAPGMSRWQLGGGAALSGIGFTISLFIVDLAFDDDADGLADQARVGVLAASVIAALLGWTLFRLGERRRGDDDDRRPVTLDPPVDPGRDHVRGPVDAPLTLVEYGDFECPFCGRATGAVEELRERLGDRLRYVYRHVPLVDVHPHAELAAEAAEAAGAQGRFWEMHDRLFGAQDRLDVLTLLDHATALGLDVQRFARELGDGRWARRVRDDAASAEASGVEGTPTFFVNGLRHSGAYDAGTLERALLDGVPGDPLTTGADRSGGQPVPGTGQPALGMLRREDRRGALLPAPALPPDLQETPDRGGAYPRLSAGQLAGLAESGERLRLEPGRTLFREGDPGYDFYVVESGSVAIVEDWGRDSQRVIGVHGPGRFLGELNLFSSGSVVTLTAVVAEPAQVLRLGSGQLRAALTAQPPLKDLVVRAFLLRRSILLGLAADLKIVGHSGGPDVERLRAHAEAAGLNCTVVDLGEDDGATTLLEELGVAPDELPVVLFRDGPVLRNPSVQELDAVVRERGAG
jgi:Na+/H+ antiporter NhaA